MDEGRWARGQGSDWRDAAEEDAPGVRAIRAEFNRACIDQGKQPKFVRRFPLNSAQAGSDSRQGHGVRGEGQGKGQRVDKEEREVTDKGAMSWGMGEKRKQTVDTVGA